MPSEVIRLEDATQTIAYPLTITVEDRPEVEYSSGSDQFTLFADTAKNQQALTDDDAATRCLYEE